MPHDELEALVPQESVIGLGLRYGVPAEYIVYWLKRLELAVAETSNAVEIKTLSLEY